MSELAKNIAAERIRKGLSREQLAEKLQIATESLARYERGNRIPKENLVEKIAEILGISVDLLKNEQSTERPLFHSTQLTSDKIKKKSDLQELNESDDTGNPTGAGSDDLGISPEKLERAIWLPVFNYSEITEDFSMKPVEKIPLIAARFASYNTQHLFLIRQDIPFRQAVEGDISNDCLAIACSGFSFSNSKLYLVSVKGRCLIRRVTKYADGSVDLESDEGTRSLTGEEQSAQGFKILARVIARVPDSIHFFE